MVSAGAIWLSVATAPRPSSAAEPARTTSARQPTIAFENDAATRETIITVRGLSPAQQEQLANENLSTDQWQRLLSVTVDDPSLPNPPAMLGDYLLEQDAVRFTPRYPLRPGLDFRVVFRWAAIDPASDARPVERTLSVPRPPSPRSKVTAVYPSADHLPENLLKFYIHFAAPMSRGEAYQHVHLIDEASGTEVEHPFLELGEELWDPTGQRFTLFFDPGRVKRGLQPRALFGPALEEGKSYRLVIDSEWPDAEGRPLLQDFSKPFRVGAPDMSQPQFANWKITPPAADTREPLVVRLDEPLDHAMLHRVVRVRGPAGNWLSGESSLSDQESCWRYIPLVPWRAGTYQLVVETILEDLAGNSLERQFDVDVFEKIDRAVTTDYVDVPFDVK